MGVFSRAMRTHYRLILRREILSSQIKLTAISPIQRCPRTYIIFDLTVFLAFIMGGPVEEGPGLDVLMEGNNGTLRMQEP